MAFEQISMFGAHFDRPTECCYECKHFAEFREARTFLDKNKDEFTAYGMCCKSVGKNGSYTFYPIYVPLSKCKDFKKRKVEAAYGVGK